jgi:hypothetical protein
MLEGDPNLKAIFVANDDMAGSWNSQREPVLDFKSTLFLITGLFDGSLDRSLAVF